MRILLLDVLTETGKHRETEAEIGFREWKSGGRVFPVREAEPVRISMTNLGNSKVALKAETRLVLEGICDRCLTPVDVPVALSEEEELDLSKTEEERLQDLDETPYLHGAELDVDEWISTLVHIHMPMKILCSPGCKGICNRCGANLNFETCSCGQAPADPRMAAVLDIFKASQEQ